MKKITPPRYHFILLITQILILFLFSCESQKQVKEEIIATVDGRLITVNEFRIFYELDPNFGLDSSGVSALKDELDFFISQIRALRFAQENGLTKDSVFVKAADWEKRQAMLRELHRQQIADKVEVKDEELRQRYLEENMQVHVKQLFNKSRKEILQYKKELEAGVPFARIASKAFKDSTLAANGGDLGWIKLSELDENFGQAVLKLKKGQTSGIVQTRFGFHIIRLIDEKRQVILREDEFKRQHLQLEKKVSQEKSMEKSRLFIQAFMKSKNPQLDPKIYTQMWREVVTAQEREKKKLNRKIIFDQGLVNKCRKNLNNFLDEPLIHYSSGGGITLGEYLNKLESIPVSQRPCFNSISILANQIAVWVRDELLYEQAKQNGLNQAEKVLSDVRRFREEQSYYYYVKSKIEKIEPGTEIQSYFNGDRKKDPYSRLAKFRNIEEWKWDFAQRQFKDELSKQIPLTVVVNNELLEKESKRINWDRRIRMFSIRKPQ